MPFLIWQNDTIGQQGCDVSYDKYIQCMLFCVSHHVLVDSHNSFAHVLQSWFTGAEAIVWILMRNIDRQLTMKKKHDQAPTLCIQGGSL